MVAAADIVRKRSADFIYVQGETAFATAGWAGVPALHTCVGLESIRVLWHGLEGFVRCPTVHHV